MPNDAARKRKWELYRERFPEIFWARVDQSGGDQACWPYMGARRAAGYGRLRVRRKHELAHRIAYQLRHGPLDDQLMVCHSCDNPPCCNPAHLFAGTHQQNVDDKVAKGRARGRLSKPAALKARRMTSGEHDA